MARFHGVANRYLPNYLGWRRMLERYSTSITPEICLQEALGELMPHLTGSVWLGAGKTEHLAGYPHSGAAQFSREGWSGILN